MAQKQAFLGTLVGGVILRKAVDIGLNRAIDRIAKSPSLSVTPASVAPIKEAVANEVMKEVGSVFENLTNQEPLWRSKVLWTAMGTIATAIGGILDMYYNGSGSFNGYMAFVVTIGTAVGTVLSRIYPGKAIGR